MTDTSATIRPLLFELGGHVRGTSISIYHGQFRFISGGSEVMDNALTGSDANTGVIVFDENDYPQDAPNPHEITWSYWQTGNTVTDQTGGSDQIELYIDGDQKGKENSFAFSNGAYGNDPGCWGEYCSNQGPTIVYDLTAIGNGDFVWPYTPTTSLKLWADEGRTGTSTDYTAEQVDIIQRTILYSHYSSLLLHLHHNMLARRTNIVL